MKRSEHFFLHPAVLVAAVAMLALSACGQVQSASKPGDSAEPASPSVLDGPGAVSAAPIDELQAALKLLMAGPSDASQALTDDSDAPAPPVEMSVEPPAEPAQTASEVPDEAPEPAPSTRPEPIFDGMPPEDTLPADTPGEAVRLWTESDADEPVAMTDSVHLEVALLRRDIQRLNHNLEGLLHHYVGSLHEENERLRQEIQRLYVMQMQEGRMNSAVPRPNAGILDAMRDDLLMSGLPPMDAPGPGRVTSEPIPLDEAGSPPVQAVRPLEDGPGVMALDTHGDTQYAVIEEWGRTPEEARSFGEGITSLKGLILAVQPGLTKGDLEELAHGIRHEHDAFDNINVKIFEGVDAAQRYANSNEVTPGTLVVDITKHAASQRDIILVLDGDELTVLAGSGRAPSSTSAAAPAAAPTSRGETGAPLYRDALITRERPGESRTDDPPGDIEEEPAWSLEALMELTRPVESLSVDSAPGDTTPEVTAPDEIEAEDAAPQDLETEPPPIFVPADQYDAGNAP